MNRARFWALALLVLSGSGAWAADSLVVADFDAVTPEVFSFKDEKGSLLNTSGAYPDPEKGKVAGIKYDILAGGWGGWGLVLKGANVSGYRYLAFDLRGEKGGEIFQLGLRDTQGQERKKAISLYVDTPTTWQRVYVPLADFAGVNLASLDNLNLGFGSKLKGRVFFDNIAFEGAPESPAAAAPSAAPTAVGSPAVPVTGDVANKVVVDGFDRTNPDTAYRTFSGDASQINLASSRILYDGDYSMEIQYKLLTESSWGSWVSALRAPAQPLDWSGVDAVKVWVKGDGSDNYFRFRFTQADGQVWENTDKKVLSSNRWTLVAFPIRDFTLADQKARGVAPKLVGIKSFELRIVSPTSSTTAGAKSSGGTNLGGPSVRDGGTVAGKRHRSRQGSRPRGRAAGGAGRRSLDSTARAGRRQLGFQLDRLHGIFSHPGRAKPGQQQREAGHHREIGQLQRPRGVRFGVPGIWAGVGLRRVHGDVHG
ncbi:MAG: CIA30 family protein [Elusimicrobia bacterium]|nr:CIA30 family protein [Elusimicrobiota bacterium]